MGREGQLGETVRASREQVFRISDFASCAPSTAGTRIISASEPGRNCEASIVIHSDLLCSSNSLLPLHKKENEKIYCRMMEEAGDSGPGVQAGSGRDMRKEEL